jgi:hypothetical protein
VFTLAFEIPFLSGDGIHPEQTSHPALKLSFHIFHRESLGPRSLKCLRSHSGFSAWYWELFRARGTLCEGATARLTKVKCEGFYGAETISFVLIAR